MDNTIAVEKQFEWRIHEKPEKKKASTLLIWHMARRGLVSIHWYAAGMLIAVLRVGIQFLAPIPSAIIVGSVLPMVTEPASSSYALISCCIAWAVIRLVSAGVTFLYSYLTSEGSFNLLLHLRKKFLLDLEKMTSDARERFGIGRLYTTYTTDLMSYGRFYSDFVPSLLGDLLTVISTFTIIYLLSPSLFFILLLAIPVQIFVMTFFRWRILYLHQKSNAIRDGAMGLFNEALVNHDLIKAFDAQGRIADKTIGKLEEMIDERRKARDRRNLWSIISSVVSLTFSIGVALISGLQVIDGVISLTFYIVINSYARQVIAPIQSLIQSFQKIIPLLVSVEWCEEFFDAVEPAKDAHRTERLALTAHNMSFGGVEFRYPDTPEDARPAIDDVSCEVPKGKITVLCGPSGCGKTTMLKLLRGDLEPEQGEVSIGNKDLKSINPKELSGVMATLNQKISLLSMSILENAELLKPNFRKVDLEESLRLSNILRELEDLEQEIPTKVEDPEQSSLGRFGRVLFGFGRKNVRLQQSRQGLDRVVGASGNLSGGQQQRVSIGFALLTRCPILLFDEPTSGLDKFSENDLVETISRLASEDRTIVVVSHSLPPYFVLPDDQVHFIFLKEGRLIGEGSRSELIRNCPEFREMAKENVRHVLAMDPSDLELLRN